MNDFSARRGSASAGAERAIDRRQLLRAGAWAAPVIVLATAAPAAVASVTSGPGGGLTFKATTFTLDGNINSSKAQYEYHVSVDPTFQNDNAVDTLTFVLVLNNSRLIGPVTGGGITWTRRAGTSTWNGVRPSNSRGQDAQGKFEITVAPGTRASDIAGGVTMTVTASNGSRSTPPRTLSA